MLPRVGTALGLASLACAVLTGPIAHVHPGAAGHGPLWHAHFFTGHSVHRHGPQTAFDDDDDHVDAVYLNPFVSIAGHAGPLPFVLTSTAATVTPVTLATGLASTPTEQAHGPPITVPTVLRGPPARPSSA